VKAFLSRTGQERESARQKLMEQGWSSIPFLTAALPQATDSQRNDLKDLLAKMSETLRPPDPNESAYRGDLRRTGNFPSVPPVGPVEVKWRVSVGEVGHSPAVTRTSVIVGLESGNFQARTVSDGKLLWEVGLGSPVRAVPIVAAGLVIVTSLDANVHCLEESTGKLKWKYGAQGGAVSKLSTSAAVHEGVVYIVGPGAKLHAIDLQKGTSIWSLKLGDASFSAPSIKGNLLFTGLLDNAVAAVDLASRKMVWKSEIQKGSMSSTVWSDAALLIQGQQGLHGLNPQTGAIEWSHREDTPGRNEMALADGHLAFTSVTNSMRGVTKLTVLSLLDRKALWSRDWGYSITSPCMAGGIVFVGTEWKEIHALVVSTGAELWKLSLDGEIDHSPTPANHELYAVTRQGSLYCIR